MNPLSLLLIAPLLSAEASVCPESPAIEARGVWVTRWDYKTPEDVIAILDDAVSAGLNQVYFQVRGTADAYYRSSLEPWAASLSGELGQDPGWDPLALAVAEAHERGLELHAWLNVCTGWQGPGPPPPSTPPHLLRAHKDWRARNRWGEPAISEAGYHFMNPAHPDFQRHLEAVVAEVASYYEVDGIHLDYARYPAADTSFDPVTDRRLRSAQAADPNLDRARFQREELTRLVSRMKSQIVDIRPGAMVSAAVTGVYEDRLGWGKVIQGKHDFHQDSRLWAALGAVDALVPMIYWPPTDPPGGRSDFQTLVDEVVTLRPACRVLVGVNVEAGGFGMLKREISIARESGLDGVVLFAYRALRERGWFGRLRAEVFCAPAVPPRAPPRTPPQCYPAFLVQELALAFKPIEQAAFHLGPAIWAALPWPLGPRRAWIIPRSPLFQSLPSGGGSP